MTSQAGWLWTAGHRNIGVVLQSYLKRSAGDVAHMNRLGARVRLCKGAYAEPAQVAFQEREEVDGSFIELHNPADMPDPSKIDHIEEPRIKATILVPDEFLGDVLKLCQDRRGIQLDLTVGVQIPVFDEMRAGVALGESQRSGEGQRGGGEGQVLTPFADVAERVDTDCADHEATDQIPSTDWDLCEIWHATSKDGWNWVEDKQPAVRRPPKPERGFRSICTPGILVWKDKYYLYFQAYSPMVGGQVWCPVRVAYADSPYGPWTYHPEPALVPSPPGSWGNIKINDPCPVVHQGRILIYYKGAPIERGPEYVLRMQGVAFSDNPLGPFEASKLNPVINSGHETCMFPFKDGLAALVALVGPEKNTIQWSPDGENFKVMSLIQVPPVAPGPYCPDAFSDSGDGRGFTWGLCHINPDGGGAANEGEHSSS